MFRIPLTFALALLASACAILYSARPTSGVVVDASTREPIAGAVVTAEWILEGGMEHSRVGTLKIFEVVTDRSGRFEIPGWGPEPAPVNGVLDKFDPVIRILKPGYTPKSFVNEPLGEISERAAKQEHSWLSNGETFEITRFAGSPSNYLEKWEGISLLFNDVLNNGSRCDWKRIPRTVRILEDQRSRAIAQGLRPMFLDVSANKLMERKQCAPFDDFVRAYSAID
jgi:hypothetical protein